MRTKSSCRHVSDIRHLKEREASLISRKASCIIIGIVSPSLTVTSLCCTTFIPQQDLKSCLTWVSSQGKENTLNVLSLILSLRQWTPLTRDWPIVQRDLYHCLLHKAWQCASFSHVAEKIIPASGNNGDTHGWSDCSAGPLAFICNAGKRIM